MRLTPDQRGRLRDAALRGITTSGTYGAYTDTEVWRRLLDLVAGWTIILCEQEEESKSEVATPWPGCACCATREQELSDARLMLHAIIAGQGGSVTVRATDLATIPKGVRIHRRDDLEKNNVVFWLDRSQP